MGHDRPHPEIYPNLVSRLPEEGGYTFLNKVFYTSQITGEPVTINTGSLHIQYKYEPGQASFAEGLTLLDGQEDSETFSRFMEVANTFDLEIAKAEAAAKKQKNSRSFKLPWKK
jgi:hypothetical protein